MFTVEPVVGADRLERVAGALPVAIVRRRQLHLVVARLDLPQLHQPVRLGKRQRPEQDEVGDRERRRRRADAERHDQNGGDREAGRARQRAARVPQILPQDVPMRRGGVADELERSSSSHSHDSAEDRLTLASRRAKRCAHLLAVLVAERSRDRDAAAGDTRASGSPRRQAARARHAHQIGQPLASRPCATAAPSGVIR